MDVVRTIERERDIDEELMGGAKIIYTKKIPVVKIRRYKNIAFHVHVFCRIIRILLSYSCFSADSSSFVLYVKSANLRVSVTYAPYSLRHYRERSVELLHRIICNDCAMLTRYSMLRTVGIFHRIE